MDDEVSDDEEGSEVADDYDEDVSDEDSEYSDDDDYEYDENDESPKKRKRGPTTRQAKKRSSDSFDEDRKKWETEFVFR